MKRNVKWMLTAAVLGMMAWMVYNSMARVERRCEVCMEFNGRRNCARVVGATDEEARQSAQTTACGPLANGMDETIRCQNTPPVSSSCSTN